MALPHPYGRVHFRTTGRNDVAVHIRQESRPAGFVKVAQSFANYARNTQKELPRATFQSAAGLKTKTSGHPVNQTRGSRLSLLSQRAEWVR